MSTLEKPYHHGDLRSALIEAAETLLDAGGEVSLREAARMAGVTPTAAYRHFADKDALLAELAVRGFSEFGRALGEAAARAPGQALVALGRAYIRFALARPGRFRLMFGPMLARLTPRHPELHEASGRAFEALQGAAGSRDEALRNWGMVHGLAHLLLDGAVAEEDREALIDRLIC
ncbi:TetR/AcrR family transcriptional regulator [Roseococcus pinisoli]|uniref:WHG domain-containing protein n=1 Tax=Roseococcus pinisoli TaxID=2835040 RepID=A0ABS5QAS2_9PROT|nr:WHG domain-containing protein [Roseococcus pinisoli]